MRTVIIIHGSYGSPDENWIPWLKRQVEESGHQALAPAFPTPEGQSLEAWRQIFEKQAGSLTGDHLLVGHSLGVAFILDILERSAGAVRGSFFASGFVGELGDPVFDDVNRTFSCKEFNWQRIRENMGSAFMYHGDNDPYVPRSKSLELAGHLKLSPKFIPNGGHLNSTAGYVRFDALWSDISKLLSGDG